MMTLSEQQIAQYLDTGFLVLEDFASESDCDRLRARAKELVHEFDPAEVVSIFTTREQNRIADDYFLTSGDKICFFFEENAFNEDGTLKYEKEKSINKIGHALHDLDPVFDHFSRNQNVKELAAALGFKDPLLLQSPNSRHAYTLHLIHAGATYPRDNWLQRSATMPLRGFD